MIYPSHLGLLRRELHICVIIIIHTLHSHVIIHADFHQLFKMFMDRSLERLRSVAGYPDVTIWTSSLTTEKYIDDLRTEDYTIQGYLILLNVLIFIHLVKLKE